MGPISVALPAQLHSSTYRSTEQQDSGKKQKNSSSNIKNNINNKSQQVNRHPISSELKQINSTSTHPITPDTKPTMRATLRAARQPNHHEPKGKIINKLALVLLSIVILELVLIGDQVQPVKAIKKKIFLKKLKKMLPLLALIKPKKKIILLPIPIPMQMMKQSHFGGRYPTGPSLIMPMGQMDLSQQQPLKPPTNNAYDMGSSSAPMMMGSVYPEGGGGNVGSSGNTGLDSGVLSLPPAGSTMQMVAPPTTMTMTITAGGSSEVSSAPPSLPTSGVGMMVPAAAPGPSSPLLLSHYHNNNNNNGPSSGNLLSYQAASASVAHGDPSGELYYSSPYGSGGGASHKNNANNMPNIAQLQSKIQTNNNHARLRSPVHYGQQQQQQNHNRHRQPSYDISGQQQHHQQQQQQQQQQMSMHEIEMEFSPSAPIQQQHHQQPLKQQQMIPFYPSDSEPSQSAYNSVVHLPVLHNHNYYSGKLNNQPQTNNNNNPEQLQQLREIAEPSKSSLPVQAQPIKSVAHAKVTSAGGY